MLSPKNIARKVRARLLPLFDISAWFLFALSAVPLILINPAMIVTLGTWTAYGIALAGLSVVLNRLVLPHIRLAWWLGRCVEGNLAAGLVVAATIGLNATFFIGLILWAKA